MVLNAEYPLSAEVALTAHNIPGQSWLRELKWLADAFSHSQSHVEVGVFCGRSLFASCVGMTQEAMVIAVDDESQVPDFWEPGAGWVQAQRKLTIHAIHSLKPRVRITEVAKTSVDAALWCGAQGLQFDSIFIDGDHSFEAVKSDIESWLPLIRPGGLIAGHDFWAAHPGVMDAVNELIDDFEVVPTTRLWYARKS